MADYKDLIRKAIQALPENNGAARRAVYEKARTALVTQLRSLEPPLPPREITQHRLQLEDCIRQVEQEASEAVIAGLKQNEELSGRHQAKGTPGKPAAAAEGEAAEPPAPMRPSVVHSAPPTAAPRPPVTNKLNAPTVARPAGSPGVAAAAAAPVLRPAPAARPVLRAEAASYPRAVPTPVPVAEPGTIEDIIAAAEGTQAKPAAADAAPISVEGQAVHDATDDAANDAAANDDAPPPATMAPPVKLEPLGPVSRIELGGSLKSESRQIPPIVARAEAVKAAHVAESTLPGAKQAGSASSVALSSVREVDVDRHDGDPQVAIERAIATLEREARNDGEAAVADEVVDADRRRGGEDADLVDLSTSADAAFARAPAEPERGGNAVTIFLGVFLLLVVVAGGVGFWAWHEGFIDFDSMFGKAGTSTGTVSAQNTAPAAPSSSPSPAVTSSNSAPASTTTPAAAAAAAQTNTEPASNVPAQSAEQMTAPAGSSSAVTPPAAATPLEPQAQMGTPAKSEDRLTQSADNSEPAAPAAAQPGADAGATAAAANGNQSLLLEASQDNTTGALPFSGTVEWSKGTDEMGQPTLVGKADIPARNLSVSVLIRKNSDPTLPASHLMEINFKVSDSFIGGSIAGLPGVLLKNEELVQGTPLVGASARVVGNSFLFALSSSPQDEATNKDLLTTRKWMDLAIIYATGKKAIITLEKDDKAQALFNQVFAEWDKEGPAKATSAPAATSAPTPASK